MAVIPVPDVWWFSLAVTCALVATVVAYSNGPISRMKQRWLLALMVVLVLGSLATTVTHAVYLDYACYYDSWWVWLQPECW